MNSSGLSPHQLAVVDSAEDALVVQASAGSGKTRVLVGLYLRRVLQENFSPDQILCVTFTNKAAAEMKSRIVSALREAGKEDEARIAETGPIQTLHSFCERVLRENSLEAGLDPDFSILAESDTQACIEDAIHQSLGETEPDSFAGQLVQLLSGKRSFGSAASHGQLLDPVRKVLHALRGTLNQPEEVLARHRSPSEYVASSYEAILQVVPEIVRDHLVAGDVPSFWKRLRSAYVAAKEPPPTWLPKKKQEDTIYELELESARWACGLASIAARAWQHLEIRMMENQALDFPLLEALAVRQMASNARIRERVNRQFPVVLIDEGQDLNPVQNQLVGALNGTFQMVVGDKNQSIYGFRQADVRLFERRSQETSTLPLPQNYRSAQSVLELIDRLFGRLWPSYEPMSHANARQASDLDNEVWASQGFDQTAEWVAELCESHSPSDIAILVRKSTDMESLAHRLEALGVAARVYGSGKSYYLRLEIRDLANLLEAVSHPQDDFALLAVLRSPIVGLSLDGMVRLAHGGGVAQKLGDTSELDPSDAAKIEPFRDWFWQQAPRAARVPAWRVLADAFALESYWPNLVKKANGARQLANIRKLFLIAADHPELNASEFAALLRQMQQLTLREGDASAIDDGVEAISLMTIHRSKGLEFPVVVLPSTDFSLARRKAPLEIDRDFGIVSFKQKGNETAIGDWIGERRKQFEKEEELRLLYVALTRARERLCIVAHPGKSGTLAKLIWDSLELDNSTPHGLSLRRVQDAQADRT